MDPSDGSGREGILLLSERTLHRGPIFSLIQAELELPSGRRQLLEVVLHPGAVAIAAIDEEGRMVLVRQYRHSLRRSMLEVPAGRLEAGELPLVAAERELEEETGLRARDWRLLCVFAPAPGFCSERIHLFLASGLEALGEQARPCDPDEEIAVERALPAEILARGCEDAKTLIAALLLLQGPPG
jgi:ADP-ribose pyrophosphatase